MKFKEMNVAELEERKLQIKTEIEEDGADLDALEAEVRAINEELEARAAEEAKKAELRNMVANMDLPIVDEVPKTEERKEMTEMEIRSSREYAQAFLNGWRNGDKEMSECRALLTTNTTGQGLTGYVPVPTELDTEIKTAWEEYQLASLVTKSYFKGNVKVGFELSATGANVHIEGTAADNEEVVTLGAVEIKAANIKKWIRVSDEALEGTTVDTVGYLYKEIAHRIVEKAEEIIISTITACGTTATATAVGVPQLTASALAATTIIDTLALLAGSAQDIHIAMNRGTYAAFRAIELAGSYAIDIFEGLRDRIVFTDKLKAFSAASANDIVIIAGDFSAVQANFPNGDGVNILVDPYTDAQSDLVKIVGREYVGFGVTKDKHLATVKKVASNG